MDQRLLMKTAQSGLPDEDRPVRISNLFVVLLPGPCTRIVNRPAGSLCIPAVKRASFESSFKNNKRRTVLGPYQSVRSISVALGRYVFYISARDRVVNVILAYVGRLENCYVWPRFTNQPVVNVGFNQNFMTQKLP